MIATRYTTTQKLQAAVGLLVIVAAASVDDPHDALHLARVARHEPDKALAQNFDASKVAEIYAAIKEAKEDPEKKLEPSDAVQAAAAAVGANPRLVAAAAELLEVSGVPPDPAHPENNTRGWNARRWAIDLVDPDVLERAVRAALRARALEALTVGEDMRSLQRKVEELLGDVRHLQQTDATTLQELERIKQKVDSSKGRGVTP